MVLVLHSPHMQRFVLRVAYDGAAFLGSAGPRVPQMRPPPEGQRSVVEALQAAVAAVGGDASTSAEWGVAARTDSGVHADDNLVQFDWLRRSRAGEATLPPLTPHQLHMALRQHCGRDGLTVTAVAAVPPSYSVRGRVVGKRYVYQLVAPLPLPHACEADATRRDADNGGGLAAGRVSGAVWCAPDLSRRAWVLRWPVDVAAMQAAASVLVGPHDFTSFRASGCTARSAEKAITRLAVTCRPLTHWWEGRGGSADRGVALATHDGALAWGSVTALQLVRVTVEGDSFLYKQVGG
jgi:tRNA pseudouridine38-40 synthase